MWGVGGGGSATKYIKTSLSLSRCHAKIAFATTKFTQILQATKTKKKLQTDDDKRVAGAIHQPPFANLFGKYVAGRSTATYACIGWDKIIDATIYHWLAVDVFQSAHTFRSASRGGARAMAYELCVLRRSRCPNSPVCFSAYFPCKEKFNGISHPLRLERPTDRNIGESKYTSGKYRFVSIATCE